MGVKDHKTGPPSRIPFAVLTVSDTRTVETDRGGAKARSLLEGAGHVVVEHRIVPDEPDEIRAAVLDLLAGETEALCVTGGTGIAPRDGTPEAVEALLDRVLPGFGELFRHLSYLEIGAAAMLSRALAGTKEGKAVFVVPGSPAAVRLAMEKLILPETGHILREARKA